jgi:hypothetical protein
LCGSGTLGQNIPADLPDRVAPKLVKHYERVKNDPRVHGYYENHRVTARHGDKRVRHLMSLLVVADTANLIAYLRVKGGLFERFV